MPFMVEGTGRRVVEEVGVGWDVGGVEEEGDGRAVLEVVVGWWNRGVKG